MLRPHGTEISLSKKRQAGGSRKAPARFCVRLYRVRGAAPWPRPLAVLRRRAAEPAAEYFGEIAGIGKTGVVRDFEYAFVRIRQQFDAFVQPVFGQILHGRLAQLLAEYGAALAFAHVSRRGDVGEGYAFPVLFLHERQHAFQRVYFERRVPPLLPPLRRGVFADVREYGEKQALHSQNARFLALPAYDFFDLVDNPALPAGIFVEVQIVETGSVRQRRDEAAFDLARHAEQQGIEQHAYKVAFLPRGGKTGVYPSGVHDQAVAFVNTHRRAAYPVIHTPGQRSDKLDVFVPVRFGMICRP